MGWPGYAFMERLRIVKEKVKEWSKKEYGSKKIIKETIERRINELDNLEGRDSWNLHLIAERRVLKKEW